MEKKQDDLKRNRPVEKGRDNDPNIRDYSAQQPGVNTMSDSGTDEEFNQRLTKTSSGKATGDDFGADADPAFDEIGEDRDDDK
jgi:hypothetical protein